MVHIIETLNVARRRNMCILDSGRVTIPVASLMEEGSKSKWCSPGG